MAANSPQQTQIGTELAFENVSTHGAEMEARRLDARQIAHPKARFRSDMICGVYLYHMLIEVGERRRWMI